jgi:hypothetical protein
MNCRFLLLGPLVLLNFSLLGCFSKKSEPEIVPVTVPAVKVIKKELPVKDKELQTITRYFAQADAIHREAWRIMTGIKLPASKTPFGKLQRAALSAQNIKLTNKSLFTCDRYVMKRDILSPSGLPQRAEVFEKCSEKSESRKIADWTYEKNEVVKIIFYADHMQEVLGVGATIMNRTMECELKGNSNEALESLICKKWAQDKTPEEMIRLDTYEYHKDDKDLLRLKGKVFVNLSETRKIEASVPLTGKITVTETELYAPTEEPKVPVKAAADAKPAELPPGQTRPAKPDVVQGAPGQPAPGAQVQPLPQSPSGRAGQRGREAVHESGELVPPQQPGQAPAADPHGPRPVQMHQETETVPENEGGDEQQQEVSPEQQGDEPNYPTPDQQINPEGQGEVPSQQQR